MRGVARGHCRTGTSLTPSTACVVTTPEGRLRCSYVVEDVTDRKRADAEVARLKLESLGVAIDELTDARRMYLSAWEQPLR